MSDDLNPELEWFKGIVARWYRHVILAVLVAISGVYVARSIMTRQKANLEQAADLFDRVHQKFQEIKTAKAEKSAKQDVSGEEQNKIEEKTNVLREMILLLRDSPEPYSSFAALYEAALTQTSGDAANSLTALESIGDWTKQGDVDSVARFSAELAALARARVQLGDETTKSQALASLLRLTNEARYVGAASGLVLAQMADSEEERIKTLGALEDLVRRFPEQGEFLEEDLANLRRR